jgi:hypothetical protein
MEVIGQLHASSVLSPKIEFLLSSGHGLGGLLNSKLWRGERICLSLPGKNPLFPLAFQSPELSHCSDWAIHPGSTKTCLIVGLSTCECVLKLLRVCQSGGVMEWPINGYDSKVMLRVSQERDELCRRQWLLIIWLSLCCLTADFMQCLSAVFTVATFTHSYWPSLL